MNMFEYLSCNIPLTSSDLPVLKEVLDLKWNCILVECNKINECSKQVNELLDNKNLEVYISKNGFNDFVEKFTWDKRA